MSEMSTLKSDSCNLATIDLGNRRRLVQLRTLRTCDFDELADVFPRWNLRLRQIGRGPFRGQLQLLQHEGTQVFQLAVNRMTHIEGWLDPPGSFGCFPVLAANEKAIWHGRRLKVGQVRVFDP